MTTKNLTILVVNIVKQTRVVYQNNIIVKRTPTHV